MPTDLRKGRRITRLRASIALFLASTLVLLLNLFAVLKHDRIFVKNRLSSLGPHSEAILTNLQGRIEIIAFSDAENSLRDSVRATLEEFSDKAQNLDEHRLRVSYLSTQGNAAEVADLTRRYNAPQNAIIVRNLDGAGHCVIPYEELVQEIPGQHNGSDNSVFVAETRIAAALWNVSRSSNPTVYFLSGFGEYNPDDYNQQSGYSAVANELRRNLYSVKTLDASAPDTPIPTDCSVLIIAGSRVELSIPTIERLSAYLASGGRLFLLLGSTPDLGMAGLLRRWGVTTHAPIPAASTLHALQIVSTTNPSVQFLRKALPPTLGGAIRLSTPDEFVSATSADLPRTDVLLSTQDGKANLAIAVERGATAPSSGLPQSTRIIVIGDSEFAANSLAGSGYDSNRDFFLACVDWLAERQLHLDRPRATYTVLRSGLSSAARWRSTIAYVVLAWPLAIFLFGRLLYHRRV